MTSHVITCTGKVHPDNGTLTGDSIAYIYPDMDTAFIGIFENKFMRAARETEVKVGVTSLRKPSLHLPLGKYHNLQFNYLLKASTKPIVNFMNLYKVGVLSNCHES